MHLHDQFLENVAYHTQVEMVCAGGMSVTV